MSLSEVRQNQGADDIDKDGNFRCSPDSRDLLERASAILAFLVLATADSDLTTLSRTGAAGLCHTLEYCNSLIEKAGGLSPGLDGRSLSTARP